MPDRDGYAFIVELRRLPAASGGTTPAIALTAFARSEDRTRAMLAGYQIHIAKPIEPRELVATILGIVGHAGRRELS
jgi:CheY-like chemotaxis protein